MSKIEEDILSQLKPGQDRSNPPAAERPAPKPAAADAEGDEQPLPGSMTAGQVGPDGKKRLHVFGEAFQAQYGPRRKTG